jgi:D-amino-acid dehydrogenase
MKIAIVGAGVIGLSTARSLLARGEADLTVFDRHDGPGLDASFANGALLHPSLVEPWNSPGILRYVLRNLGNDQAAVLLRWKALPSLLKWGWRFVRESSPERFVANTLANVDLARHSVQAMAGLAAEGIEFDHYARGTLVIHRDAQAFQSAREWSATLGAAGLQPQVLDVAALVALEPQLAAISGDLVGAVHNVDDQAGDSYRYCVALEAALAAKGVRFAYGRPVAAIETAAGAVSGLRIAGQDSERFDAVVLAAGSLSTALARSCGLALPVRPAKGYSITFELPTGEAAPRVPVVDSALHLAVIPVGPDRLRVAGTAEFCGDDVQIARGRIANLQGNFARVYPALARRQPPMAAREWAALRPMCSDGKPLIGATRLPGLYLNTGHGHMGWTLAAGSGRVLAAQMTGEAPEIDARPFAPGRFGL